MSAWNKNTCTISNLSTVCRTWYQTETQKKSVVSVSKASADKEVLVAKLGKQEALRLAIEQVSRD
jgi:hypothetical protein